MDLCDDGWQTNLDAKVVYELIQSHGRTDIYLFYAGLLEDHDIVIQHHIDNESWLASIDVLNRQVRKVLFPIHSNRTADCSYRHSLP